MSRRMMRYVMPAGDTELEITFRGGDNFHVTGSSEANIYIYIEEADDELSTTEYATFKAFETGEAVEGTYLGSVSIGKNAKHIYWVNMMESDKYDAARNIRESVHMPEVSVSGGSDISESSSG